MSEPSLFWFLGEPAVITRTLFVAVFSACLGSSIPFGYSMAVLNNLDFKVKCFIMPQFCPGNHSEDDESKANILYSGLTATYVVLGTVGCFLSGIFNDYFGRRNGLFLNNFIAFIGGILSIMVMITKRKVYIFLARLVFGLHAGLSTGIAPTFMAEISPTSIRGAVTAFHQISITIGIMLAYAVTLKCTLNRPVIWFLALAVPVIPAGISIMVLLFCPESPRYLYINRNNVEKAKKAFGKYNQIQDVSDLLQEIKEEAAAQHLLPKFTFFELFKNKTYRLPMIISVVLNFMQQFSGINAIIGYSQSMFKNAQIDEYIIEYCVLAIGVLNTVTTIPTILLIEVVGRRRLLIYPTILSILSLLGSFLTIGVLPIIEPQSIPLFAIISIVFIGFFIVGFANGMGPITGIMSAEVFTQTPRATAYSFVIGVQWFSSFLILQLYPIASNYLKPGFVFLFFMSIVVISLIYLWRVMPETKNRSFADIAKGLSGNTVDTDAADKT